MCLNQDDTPVISNPVLACGHPQVFTSDSNWNMANAADLGLCYNCWKERYDKQRNNACQAMIKFREERSLMKFSVPTWAWIPGVGEVELKGVETEDEFWEAVNQAYGK